MYQKGNGSKVTERLLGSTNRYRARRHETKNEAASAAAHQRRRLMLCEHEALDMNPLTTANVLPL